MDEIIQKLIDRATKESKGISVINSVDQLREFYTDNVARYSEWRAIASIEDWLPVDAEFLQSFRKQLSINGVHTKVIFKESGLKFERESLEKREVKVIPDSYRFRSSLDILDDKILIMNPHQTILGLVLESRPFVDVFVDVFDVLWQSLPNRQ